MFAMLYSHATWADGCSVFWSNEKEGRSPVTNHWAHFPTLIPPETRVTRVQSWESKSITQYHAEVYSTPHVISATQTCYITLWNRVRIVAKDSSDVDSIDNAFFFFFTRLQSVSLPVARILKWDVASVGRCICRENILRNRLFKNIYFFLSITAFLLLLLLRGLLSQNH